MFVWGWTMWPVYHDEVRPINRGRRFLQAGVRGRSRFRRCGKRFAGLPDGSGIAGGRFGGGDRIIVSRQRAWTLPQQAALVALAGLILARLALPEGRTP